MSTDTLKPKRKSVVTARVPATKPSHDVGRNLSKVDETYTHLLSLAHRLGPHAKMPTVRALREEINVSQATLDAALARLEDQNVVVRRQGSGVYVSHRLRQRNIALLFDPEYFLSYGVSPFWGLLVEQIRELANQNEVHLSLHFLSHWVESELVYPQDPTPLQDSLREAISSGGIHGVLAIGAPHVVTRWIESQGVSVVSYAGAAKYMFAHSSSTLVQMGVAELAKQGCKRIEFWSHIECRNSHGVSFPYQPLYELYRGAMLAHNLTPLTSPLDSISINGIVARSSEEGFYRALQRFGPGVPSSERPDAILSTDDMLTQGLLMGFYRLGIPLNRDIRIATHANAGSQVLLGWQHQLTLLEYDLGKMVQLLFETLEALMNGEKPDWEAQVAQSPEITYSMEPRVVLPSE